MTWKRPRPTRRAIAATFAVALAGAFFWLWPLDSTEPLAAWVPGESGLRGSLARVMAADPGLSLIGTHAPNILVLRSDVPGFALRLLAAGAIPFTARSSDVICR